MSCRFLKFLLALVILMATMILPKDFLFAMQVSQQVAESVIDNSETEKLELKLTPYSVDSYGEGNLYNLNAEGVTAANTPGIWRVGEWATWRILRYRVETESRKGWQNVAPWLQPGDYGRRLTNGVPSGTALNPETSE